MYRQTSVRSFLLRAWQSSWKVWRAVLLGNLTVLIVTEFAKGLISEARPHFWDTCKPNVTQEMCNAGYVTVEWLNQIRKFHWTVVVILCSSYVVEFTCTSDYSNRKILDAQKSFPSGHTSLSAYVSLFMMVLLLFFISIYPRFAFQQSIQLRCFVFFFKWYLGRAVESRHSFVLKPCLQFIWAAFAIVCALTRITDRRHHWWDVLAGLVLGVTIATILVKLTISNDYYICCWVVVIKKSIEWQIQAVSRSIRWSDAGDDDDSAADGGASHDSSEQGQQFKDGTGTSGGNGNGGMNFQMTGNASADHNKRPSVRRLLSTSSAATTIAEDSEINI